MFSRGRFLFLAVINSCCLLMEKDLGCIIALSSWNLTLFAQSLTCLSILAECKFTFFGIKGFDLCWIYCGWPLVAKFVFVRFAFGISPWRNWYRIFYVLRGRGIILFFGDYLVIFRPNLCYNLTFWGHLKASEQPSVLGSLLFFRGAV
jgi:hypothetical protein